MEDKILMEFNVSTKNKKTLLDIDCKVSVETKLSDVIEIVLTNHNLNIKAIEYIYAFMPFKDDPLLLDLTQCSRTLKDFDFTNGLILLLIYAKG